MASISSLSGSSSSSSIYGNRTTNILSGLASGLDTEGMIEGLISSYQQKISGLQQDITKLQWQQQGYQSISDKLVEFARKYTSYTSSTNLFSSSFFNKAVNVSTSGTYADAISASGKTNSTIEINKVLNLATSSRYTHDNSLGGINTDGKLTSEATDLVSEIDENVMTGSMTFVYGSKKVSIDISKDDLMGDENGKLDMNKLADVINEKLSEVSIADSSNEIVKASELISVSVDKDKGTLSFSDKKGSNTVSIYAATGNLTKHIEGLSDAIRDESSTLTFDTDAKVTNSLTGAEYLEGKTISVTLNGETKKITIGKVEKQGNEQWLNQSLARVLNDSIADAFGEGKVKVSAKSGKLEFDVTEGNSFAITSEDENTQNVLGIGENGLASYLDTSRTLGSLFKVDETTGALDGLDAMVGEGLLDADGNIDTDKIIIKDGKRYDTAGNLVDQDGYRVVEDEDGKTSRLYSIEINGVEIGQYSKDTPLETIINNINSNAEAGVNVSYSSLSNQFVFTSKQTGAGGQISIGDGLANKLFGTVNTTGDNKNFEAGKDATIEATINGKDVTLTRSSNTFEIDGLNITINDTFEVKDGEKPVTFVSKTDTDTIVDAIKSMVEDYNAIINDVRSAYTTQPLKTSSGGRYEPLTDEDEEGMTENEIEKYEEKAKTGILYMDRDLSSLYSALRSAITPGGSDTSILKSIGIETEYEDGVTTLKLDETALRNALEEDPDKVRDAFTKSKENGAQSDGLMASIQEVTDKYAATTGAVKGILIEKAGSQYSPTAALDNTLLNKMQEIEEEISMWQDKMSNKVDYYTNKFTQLELLINQMNSQSSSLASLTGGY